jgi:hypothetical protein
MPIGMVRISQIGGRPIPWAATESNAAISGDEHPNGDVDYGTFEAKLTMSEAEPTMTGTWRFTGGTGKFAKITGNGVFNGKQPSLTDSEMTWSGSYSLG